MSKDLEKLMIEQIRNESESGYIYLGMAVAMSDLSFSKKHEKKITASIHKMYDLAVKDKDYESQNMLNWFINEQIEEEEQTQYMLNRLKLAEKNICATLQIDKEAGARGD